MWHTGYESKVNVQEDLSRDLSSTRTSPYSSTNYVNEVIECLFCSIYVWVCLLILGTSSVLPYYCMALINVIPKHKGFFLFAFVSLFLAETGFLHVTSPTTQELVCRPGWPRIRNLPAPASPALGLMACATAHLASRPSHHTQAASFLASHSIVGVCFL